MRTVTQLARQGEAIVRRRLAHHFLLRGAAGLAGARGEDDAGDDRLGEGDVVIQPVFERGADGAVDERQNLRVVQAIFRLPLELWLLHEDTQDPDHAFADVVRGEGDAFRREVVRLDEIADRLADAGAQTILVRPAGSGGDAVDVAANVLVRRLGPLQREIDAQVVVA